MTGDTLGKIASKYGISLSALRSANPGLDDRHLRVGQSLTIPAR
jgi:LysM repeat protein